MRKHNFPGLGRFDHCQLFRAVLYKIGSLKNSSVAMTPEKTATLSDWKSCPEKGNPWITAA